MSRKPALSNQWSNDLQNMELLLKVFEEIGGNKESALPMDFVSPYRKVSEAFSQYTIPLLCVCQTPLTFPTLSNTQYCRQDDFKLRELSTQATKKVESRLYLFNDMVIIAKHDNTSSLGTRITKKDNKEKKSSYFKSATLRMTGRRTSKQAMDASAAGVLDFKVKFAHCIFLDKCTVKVSVCLNYD